jgi:hypothetical protein
MRALPAGPTVLDMLANAAFLIGLSLWLGGQDPRWTYQLSFERAEHNFYRAAQHGLTAQLTWPLGRGGSPRTGPASELVAELLPLAREGLLRADMVPAEVERLIDVIAGRIATGQTGATWQRRALAAAARRLDRPSALEAMLNGYLDLAATGQPVHTWPTPP